MSIIGNITKKTTIQEFEAFKGPHGRFSRAYNHLVGNSDYDLKTALFKAVAVGNSTLIKYILTEQPDLVNTEMRSTMPDWMSNGYACGGRYSNVNPLLWACSHHQNEAIETLISFGAKDNPLDRDKYAPSALWLATKRRPRLYPFLKGGRYLDFNRPPTDPRESCIKCAQTLIENGVIDSSHFNDRQWGMIREIYQRKEQTKTFMIDNLLPKDLTNIVMDY